MISRKAWVEGLTINQHKTLTCLADEMADLKVILFNRLKESMHEVSRAKAVEAYRDSVDMDESTDLEHWFIAANGQIFRVVKCSETHQSIGYYATSLEV